MPLVVDFASYLNLIFPAMIVPQCIDAKTDKLGAPAKREGWWKRYVEKVPNSQRADAVSVEGWIAFPANS